MSKPQDYKKDQRESVCVIGVGYVGLTLAISMAKSNLDVFGVEVNPAIIRGLKKKKSTFVEKGIDRLLSDVIFKNKFKFAKKIPKKNIFTTYIITVGTPLDKNGKPRLDMISNATREVGSSMNDNCLIILRSTVSMGTTRSIVLPILKRTGKKFQLAMCPERTIEGNAMEEITLIPQIIGSDCEETNLRCHKLFTNITTKTTIVSSWETAELIKLADNTYRDVKFAFGNEIAKISNLYNVDCYEVIEKGKSNYKRTDIGIPGPVGGPCLEKDPHILASSTEKAGSNAWISLASRKTNELQNDEISKILKKYLNKIKRNKINILFCGLAFKGIPETDDLRGSMGIQMVKLFKTSNKFNHTLFDPIVKNSALKQYGKTSTLSSLKSKKFDLVIILNNHPFFKAQGLEFFHEILSEQGIIFDYWKNFNIFTNDHDSAIYYHLGNLHKL